MTTALTINDLLQEAGEHLQHLASARLDAELLLCNVLALARTGLYAAPHTLVTPEQAGHYRQLINDRKAGKPLAYLTGKKEFWSLEFAVDSHTLIPRPETECLVELALTLIPTEAHMSIADLGTGSGAIAIALASERPGCRLTATDICEHALAMAETNAERHGMRHINFIKSDWYIGLDGRFDMIVSNPPYVADGDAHLEGDGTAHEPQLALNGGKDGLESINRIVRQAPAHLNPGGWLLVEHGYDQAEAVRALFTQSGFTEVQSHRDYAGIERVTRGRTAA